MRETEAPQEKLRKLEASLASHPFSLQEALPLFAALLAIPLPAQYPPLPLSPQQHRQRTLEALVLWLLQETERQPVLFIVEDLHWSDPSTLELLSLIIQQAPSVRLFTLLLFRPTFQPPWGLQEHLTSLMLGRLTRPEVEVMLERLAGGKPLPAAVRHQIVSKTDGVPLFVEELTKMVLGSGSSRSERIATSCAVPCCRWWFPPRCMTP
ncbi:MAG: hypothetical protein V3U27_16415 [Candidatus Tectomicrobia bacterium]